MILTIMKAQDIELLLRTSFFLTLRANKCVSLLFVRLHWISFSVKIKSTVPTTIMKVLGFFNYIVKSLNPLYNQTVYIIINSLLEMILILKWYFVFVFMIQLSVLISLDFLYEAQTVTKINTFMFKRPDIIMHFHALDKS